MLTDIQKGIIKIVETEPGIGPGGVADSLGRDKSLTRRDMRNLAKRGHLIEQDNGNGYAFFPVAGQSVPVSKKAQTPQVLRRAEPAIIGYFGD